MKKLLFLAGLIMVAAACSPGLDSGSRNSASEESPDCRYSFVFCGYDGQGRSAYDVCKAAFDKSSKVLFLFMDSGERFSYKLSDIKDEYISKVKANKVTIFYDSGKAYPAVIEKADPLTFKTIEADNRRFTFHSILKDDPEVKEILYRQLYMGIYVYGFSKIGNRMLKDNCFFFYEEDLTPEKTGDEFTSKGRYSAARTADGGYTMCQARYEDGYLLIRVEDGSTFRYPLELFDVAPVRDMITGKGFFSVSAVQIPNGNWLPASIQNNRALLWYEEMIRQTSFYYSIFGKTLDMPVYCEYMMSRGIGDLIGKKVTDPFFEFSQ